MIDVTVPLQCLVKDSKLILTEASKVQRQAPQDSDKGFWGQWPLGMALWPFHRISVLPNLIPKLCPRCSNLFHAFIHPFTQQVFTKHLLCASHNSKQNPSAPFQGRPVFAVSLLSPAHYLGPSFASVTCYLSLQRPYLCAL